MSDSEVDAYIKEHGLGHLATSERIEAILAMAAAAVPLPGDPHPATGSGAEEPDPNGSPTGGCPSRRAAGGGRGKYN